jgi:Ca2+-binding RTX toxin-like protein
MNAGPQMLVVGGTTGSDVLQVDPGPNGQVKVFVNGVSIGLYQPTSRIILYGQAGDDRITSHSALSVWMYGGAGNDNLQGGSGDDVLLGEDGDDHITGGSGDDLMVGGRGADRLVGSSGGDILIAAYLAQMTEADLGVVQSAWTSDAAYEDRISALDDVLNEQTVFDDAARDMLTGASGLDWFFAELDSGDGQVEDQITGSHRDEELVDLVVILTQQENQL